MDTGLNFMTTWQLAGMIGVPLFLILAFAINVLREYERGVIFFLGRYQKVKGPGLILVIPVLQQMVKVDLRTVVMDVPTQDVISRDNVSVKVSAVVYFKVIHPEKAVIKVEDFEHATSQLAQTTLRSVLGHHELDEMLSERDKLNRAIQEILDKQAEAWGINVSNVEIKQMDLNDNMVRAIAKQAEAERERRAKIIHAEGELQSSQKILEAASILAQHPQAIQLRYLQTLSDISSEKSHTVIFPLPMDLISPLQELIKLQNLKDKRSLSNPPKND